MARKQKTVRISFFELVDGMDGTRPRSFDWQDRLSRFSGRSTPPFRHGSGEVDGLVFGHPGNLSLSLAVDRAMSARQRNRSSGERKDMATDGDEWDPSEESFAVLFDWNVFGLLRTSTAAPGHAAVARWLSLHLPPVRQTGSHWKATPVVDPGKWDELLQSGKEINAVDFALKPGDAPALDSPILGSMVRNIFGGYDDGLEISVSVRAGRKRQGSHRNRERLQEELLQVIPADQRDGFLKRAEVKALPLDGGPQETINLIEQKLSTQVEIPIPEYDPQGEELAAIAAGEIRRAYSEMRDEIEGLVGPS